MFVIDILNIISRFAHKKQEYWNIRKQSELDINTALV